MGNMMKAKRISFVTAGMLHGMLDVKCELEDGTNWHFKGSTALDLGVHMDFSGKGKELEKGVKVELRWPNSGGATLDGHCAWSAFAFGAVTGYAGFIMWDFHGTVATISGLKFGIGGNVVPIGWGEWKKISKWD